MYNLTGVIYLTVVQNNYNNICRVCVIFTFTGGAKKFFFFRHDCLKNKKWDKYLNWPNIPNERRRKETTPDEAKIAKPRATRVGTGADWPGWQVGQISLGRINYRRFKHCWANFCRRYLTFRAGLQQTRPGYHQRAREYNYNGGKIFIFAIGGNKGRICPQVF